MTCSVKWKPDICSQTVLPDRLLLIGQKLVENAKINQIRYFLKVISNFSLRKHLCKTNLKQISKGDKVSQLEEGKNKYEVYE